MRDTPEEEEVEEEEEEEWTEEPRADVVVVEVDLERISCLGEVEREVGTDVDVVDTVWEKEEETAIEEETMALTAGTGVGLDMKRISSEASEAPPMTAVAPEGIEKTPELVSELTPALLPEAKDGVGGGTGVVDGVTHSE